MKLIHYCAEPFELEPRPYNQSDLVWQAKPSGLWVSVESSEFGEINYNWREWCEAEEFNLEKLECAYEIELKEDASILHLKTYDEIFEFTKKYNGSTSSFDHVIDAYHIQWEEVKKLHQGIILAPYQWYCRLHLESLWYYGWDCSSGCIWDLTCIKEFKQIKAENVGSHEIQ
jgi:hypothetical protein